MEALLLISALLQSLSTIAGDPALGDRGKAISGILKLMNLALSRGGEATTELRALAEEVRAMVDSGTQPTEDQWLSLKSRSDAAHAILNLP